MDLNIILIILGVLALVILVAHGLWANRREKTQFFKNANTFTRDGRIEHPNYQKNHRHATQSTQNDILNTPVQTPTVETPVATTYAAEPMVQDIQDPIQQGLNFDAPEETVTATQDVSKIKITIPGTEQTQTVENNDFNTVSNSSIQIRSTPAVQLQDDGSVVQRSNTETQSIFANPFAEVEVNEEPQPVRQPDVYVQTRQPAEPETVKVEPTISIKTEPEITEQISNEVEKPKRNQSNQSHLVLYVVAPEGREFQGTALFQALEDFGLVYSEQGIYHRHFDTVASPVLFSVANIRQPGTFDLENMDSFHTVGVALFMPLSGAAKNDLLSFRSMELDAKRLADKLNGFVLDDQQEVFTEQSRAEYNARIQP